MAGIVDQRSQDPTVRTGNPSHEECIIRLARRIEAAENRFPPGIEVAAVRSQRALALKPSQCRLGAVAQCLPSPFARGIADFLQVGRDQVSSGFIAITLAERWSRMRMGKVQDYARGVDG